MPTFETPEPITATVDVVMGEVGIAAGASGHTVVEVRPSDASKDDDVQAAKSTRVEYTGGNLLVKTPKLRSWSIRSGGGSVDVTIELPANSRVHGSGQLADFYCEGRLGDCRLRTGLGHLRVEQAGSVNLKNGRGDIALDRATAHADIKTGSGEVRVRELDGSAVIKNSNGETWVGVAGGDLRVASANGNISVDLARASVGAKTARGDVRLGEVERGSVVLETSAGDLEVGIPEGTAAWLDVRAVAGAVHSSLDAADAPEDSAEKVEVRARTSFGDIVIGRPLAREPVS
jgi:hypothetical protein